MIDLNQFGGFASFTDDTQKYRPDIRDSRVAFMTEKD